jgi:acyl dehydratase
MPDSELTFELLQSGLRFESVEWTIGTELVASYAAALGEVGETPPGTVPPGLAPILARRRYLACHSMPQGGVLLGQSVAWFAPAHVGRPLRLQAAVASTRVSSRRIAVIETLVRQGGEEPLARIETTVSWP